jgi:hypothetical protein
MKGGIIMMNENNWSKEKKKEIAKNLAIYLGVDVVFIILKLFGIISWSWLIVLLPLYGPFLFNLILTLVILFKADDKHK